jgi:glutaredoxin
MWLNKLEDYEFTVISKDGCKYCDKAVKILLNNNINFQKINVSDFVNEPEFDDLYDELINITKASAFPMIFQKSVFIGGYNELKNVEI